MVQSFRVLIGKRRLLGIGPEINQYKKFYTKGKGILGDPHLIFKSSNYKSNNSITSQDLAYEDAKNHLKFYNRLIDTNIYPIGTVVRIQKIDEPEVYYIEMVMPEINNVFLYATDANFWRSKEYGKEAADLLRRMEGVVSEFNSGPLHSDVERPMNYGIDPKTGKIVYIDFEIINGPLPFDSRIK